MRTSIWLASIAEEALSVQGSFRQKRRARIITALNLKGSGLFRENPGYMAHLAAGSRFRLAVEMQVSPGLGQDPLPCVHIVADEVLHFHAAETGSRSQRPAADRPDMLLELGRCGPAEGPV